MDKNKFTIELKKGLKSMGIKSYIIIILLIACFVLAGFLFFGNNGSGDKINNLEKENKELLELNDSLKTNFKELQKNGEKYIVKYDSIEKENIKYRRILNIREKQLSEKEIKIDSFQNVMDNYLAEIDSIKNIDYSKKSNKEIMDRLQKKLK